ncbi:MAG: hypothetical protein AAF620_15895, partial [Bacteroidota bacterium]
GGFFKGFYYKGHSAQPTIPPKSRLERKEAQKGKVKKTLFNERSQKGETRHHLHSTHCCHRPTRRQRFQRVQKMYSPGVANPSSDDLL